MDDSTPVDAVDEIVDELRAWLPEAEVVGLPITGRIMRLARSLEARREEQLAPYGLTVADFDVLATMRRRAVDEAINVRVLQRSTMLSSGGTTKRLDRLEAAGLIERHPDPTDRRGVLIGFTAAGRALVDEAVRAITRLEDGLVGSAVPSPALRAATEEGLRLLLVALEAG